MHRSFPPCPCRSLARARRRRRSAGAVLFIVAITLGLLAAMGLYGLSATAYDVRAAGHAREATQVHHAAEQAIVMTAETLSPGTAGEIVRAMQADPTMQARVDKACKTAKPLSLTATDQAANRIAEACLVLTPNALSRLHPITSVRGTDTSDPLKGNWENPSFATDSFGAVKLFPFVRVELTNPIDWAVPAGFATSSPYGRPPIYTQIRTTVFVELKPGADFADARDNHPAQAIATGRGRLVVGPYTP